jgi:hypothetical protein
MPHSYIALQYLHLELVKMTAVCEACHVNIKQYVQYN